ncbi:MMPL family transporter [Patulibacter minatonensis]|uniref:MMPL family transporter n=1 Tax=Patulibacter minatonensis TaxID=298163 RepID=UPI0004B56BFC|nr:MMPL family transporter [Patulibacter minatonensis]
MPSHPHAAPTPDDDSPGLGSPSSDATPPGAATPSSGATPLGPSTPPSATPRPGPPGPAAPPPDGLLHRLALICVRRRRTVVAVWVLALVVMAAGVSHLAGDSAEDYATPGAESTRAADLIDAHLGGRGAQGITVVWQDARGADGAAAKARIQPLLDRAEALPGIGEAEPQRVSRDGTIASVELGLTTKPWNLPDDTAKDVIELAEQAEGGGTRIELGGGPITNAEGGSSPEVASMIAAAVILLIAFGSVVAAGLPLLAALLGLGITFALVGLLQHVIDVPEWAPAVYSLIGIGVGIDYALLVVSRFRSALHDGKDTEGAVVEAISTAGRSALVAGGTVVVAMLGLLLMRVSYMNGVALSASISVLVVLLASVTFVPALLAMLGTRVNRLRVPLVGRQQREGHSPLAARWARGVQRRPKTAAIVGATVLVLLTIPAKDLRFGFPDAGNDRASTTTRQAYDLTTEGFGRGSNGALLLVAEGGAQQRLGAVTAAVRRDRDVAAVLPARASKDGAISVVTVLPRSAPQDASTSDLVHRLRDDVLPAATRGGDGSVLVGGVTAASIDQSDVLGARIPYFIGGVVVLSLLLLLAAFRAPLVALKAGVMNLLSVGSAYGVVTAFAQGGTLGGLIGIDTNTPVPPFIPVMMFAILFGLSMDYEVFLVSRIRERFRHHGDTERAVTEGLASTARVITAAGAIMVAVFLSFALAPEAFLKLMGVGMATAILVDATIVRMVLVPALMQLLGRWNWWIPAWLDRVLPDLEGAPATPRQAPSVAAGSAD